MSLFRNPIASRSPHPSTGGSDSEKTAVEPPSPKRPICSSCEEKFGPDHAIVPEQPLHGWPELANLMAENPEFVAFPAFRDLNIKSLLYYQCQLTKLRGELHKFEWFDHRNSQIGFSGQLCENVDFLLARKGKEDPKATKQLDKLEEIRTVLKDYST
jgi:hypothetical protein